MSFVGVDGCKAGWIAVVLRGGSVAAHFLPVIGAVTAAVADAEVIGIDIPIGLPEVPPRAADVAARRFLGRQGSSVFPTPVRAAIEAVTHAAASEASRQQTGAGISRQAFALVPKILQVEAWLPSAPCRVIEAHPEVIFRTMTGQVLASKKTWAGMRARQRALAAEGIVIDEIDDAAGRAAAVDDVLDAAAVAWTARRVAAGTATSFPNTAKAATWRSGHEEGACMDQGGYQVRFEWGAAGVGALARAGATVVVVDVLRFTTAVEAAVGRGVVVHPYRWRDASVVDFAAGLGAVLADGDGHGGGPSLSPVSLLALEPGTLVVLPSPNRVLKNAFWVFAFGFGVR